MESQKSLFDLPDDVHYLNCSYMSPSLKRVVDAGIQAVKKKSRPYEIKVNDFFEPGENLRSLYAGLINCDPLQVFLIPSVSYGISSIANNLDIPENSKLIITGEQFPSNAYTWFTVAESSGSEVQMIGPPTSIDGRGRNWNQEILEAIDERTSVVAIPQCHWADGTLFDLMAIREKTTAFGAAMVIDGTQSVGAYPFDIQEIKPDALICGGYKWLLGPYSLGLAYFDSKYNQGVPLEENWINRKGSENFSGLVDYREEYQPGALRYEVGEHSNFALIPMLHTSIEQILAWSTVEIQAYCKSITHEGIAKLRMNGFWIEDEASRGSHLFGIQLPPEVDFNLLRRSLEENKIFVSIRGTFVRVSPHVYNSKSSFDLLVDTLIHEASN